MSTRDDAIKFLRGLKLSYMGVTIYQDIIDHVLAALDDSLSSERGARDANGVLSRELESVRAECEALRRERNRRTEDLVALRRICAVACETWWPDGWDCSAEPGHKPHDRAMHALRDEAGT